MSGQLGWTSIDDLHRMILDDLLNEFKVTHLTEEEKRHLNRACVVGRPITNISEATQ
jgi:2-haloacid dehalogenase